MRKSNANSIKAFKEAVEPTRKTRKELIKATLLELKNATQRQVAAHINAPIHTVSGRFTDLMNEGVIRIVGHRKTPTNTRYGIYTRQESVYEII